MKGVLPIMIIRGYELPLVESLEYERAWPGRRPYAHQARLFEHWNRSKAFVVTTPTGTGKTLTAAFPIVSQKESAIFLYPTNALLADQLGSILRMFEDLNLKTYVFDGNEDWDSDACRESDYIIAAVNGETLETMRKRLGYNSKGQVLKKILHSSKPTIILTNPDSLYLIGTLRYAGSASLIASLQRFSNVVVDEFHLYSGIEIANLLFLLYYLRQLNCVSRIVLLSATPAENLKELINCLFKPDWIDTRLDGYKQVGQREVMHDLEFAAVMVNQRSGEKMLEQLDLIFREVINKPLSDDRHPIPLVVILNSVIEAIALEWKLIKEKGLPGKHLASYRGLINSKVRSLHGKRIVVGTSAIEIGVDFHCNILMFEAMDGPSFIQRLGRAGRHSVGRVFFFGESRLYHLLDSLNPEMERLNFEELIRQSMADRDNMSWFIFSPEGLWVAYTIIQRALMCIKNDENCEAMDGQKMSDIQEMLRQIFLEYATLVDSLGEQQSLRLLKVWSTYESEPGSWRHTWSHMKTSFRLGSFNVDVINNREYWLERPEGACFQAPLKKILEHGKGVKIAQSDKGSTNTISCRIDYFGQPQKAVVKMYHDCNVEGLLQSTQGKKFIIIGGNEVVPNDQLGEPTIYIKVPGLSKREQIDWRIETWETDDQQLIAFGGHALLLKAWWSKNVEGRK